MREIAISPLEISMLSAKEENSQMYTEGGSLALQRHRGVHHESLMTKKAIEVTVRKDAHLVFLSFGGCTCVGKRSDL